MRRLIVMGALCALLAAPAVGADERKSCAELIEQLNDPDPAVRGEAASALYDLGPEARSAVPQLIELLGDEEHYPSRYGITHLFVANIAAAALVAIGAEAVEPVGEALKHPTRRVRRSAASVLKRIGADASPALPRLMEAAKDPDFTTRAIAAEALAAIDNEGSVAVPVLRQLLGDSEHTVRAEAAKALEQYPRAARTTLPKILPLLKDEEPRVRSVTATALASFHDDADTIISALLPLLDDAEPAVRGHTVQALGKLGRRPQLVVPALLKHQHDKGRYTGGFWCGLGGWCMEWEVSGDVMEALGSFPREATTILPVVLGSLDRNPAGASKTLRRLLAHNPQVGEELMHLLERRNLSDRAKVAVLRRLGEFHVKSALPVLKQYLETPPPAPDPDSVIDPDADVGLAAACALVRIDRAGHPVAWKRTLEALKLPYVEDVVTAVATAGSDADEAVPLLIEMFRSQDFIPDHEVVRDCLGEIGPAAAEAIPDVMGHASWEYDKDSLLKMLHKIGPDAITPLVKMIDEEEGPPAECALALGSFGKEAWPAVLSLVPLCHAEKAETAAAAAQALGEIRSWPEKTVPALQQAVTHDRVAVRAAAVLALASFPDAADESVPLISKSLDDEYINVRRAAAQALGKFGKSAARATLERVAKDDPSPLVRTAAREALASIDDAAKR